MSIRLGEFKIMSSINSLTFSIQSIKIIFNLVKYKQHNKNIIVKKSNNKKIKNNRE